MTHGSIGNEGGIALAEALRVNAVLKDLNLASNQLCGIDVLGKGTYDPSGIQALAAALSSGSGVLTTIECAFHARTRDPVHACLWNCAHAFSRLPRVC